MVVATKVERRPPLRHDILMIVTLFCFTLASYGANEVRTWTAASGNTVEASLVRTAGASVILKLKNGKEVRIVRSKLSAADRSYIAAQATPASAAQATPASVHQLPFSYGKTSPEIPLRKDKTVSYHMFVPEVLKTAARWPVMFVFDPGGGRPGTLNRYIPGAKRNGWALVVSVQSSNSSKRPNEEGTYPTVDEVIALYPIDKARVYASGHSGGSRVAAIVGEHMRKRGFAGLLANGAGVGYGRVFKQSSQSSIYALCGSNCFNRWDMPTSLSKIRCKNKKLVMFPGNHDWAPAQYMTEGMSMLTGWFLKDARDVSSSYADERMRFAERQLEELQSLKDNHPGKALVWAKLLSDFKLPTRMSAEVQKEYNALRTSKAALRYLEAEKALEGLMDKHFVVSDVARCMKRADPAASKAALALAEKYADTPFAEVFRRLAKPSA